MVDNEASIEASLYGPHGKRALKRLESYGYICRIDMGWHATKKGARAWRMLKRPPTASQSVVRVLEAMGPDLSPKEWAARLDVPLSQVRKILLWAEVM